MPRRRAPLTLVALAGAATLLLAPAAAAQSQPRSAGPADERRIAPGVRVSGVDLSQLTVPEAAARLEATIGRRLERAVVVRAGGRSYRLSVSAARQRFDGELTAKRAYYAGRDRPPRGGVPTEVPVRLAVSHSRAAVAAFAARVGRGAYRAPRDAGVRITVRRMIRTRSRHGLRVDTRQLARRVSAALSNPAARHQLTQRRLRVRPRVNAAQVARRYPSVITVDRSTYRLRLFRYLRFSRSYRIAVGRAGYGTPAGLFRIQSKQINPAWHVPRSPWAGALGGRVIPGGAPNNPLKARWMGVSGSVGIHGTAERWSIGSRASRGCIRMRVPDVVDLYRRVSLGTPVLIR
jgi:lipoprotein-anchoring transpeptidase ErfK/SrfK